MRIINNTSMLRQLSDNIVANEMTNVAAVLQSPTLLATWYQPNANLTVTMDGLKNISDYIGPESQVVYDKIENMPVCGVSTLDMAAQYDEEEGYTEDFQSSGILYPNTISPIPGAMFTMNNTDVTAIYLVTDYTPCTVRSSTFTGFNFRLFSRDPKLIEYLDNKQVHDLYTVAMSSIGYEKTLVIQKTAYDKIAEHVESYLNMAYMYTMLFYDSNKAAFVFDGLPDPVMGLRRATYIDMTLWKFMFDVGIVIYDSLITYANNTLSKGVERVYTDCPDVYIDEYSFRRSILWKIYTQDRSANFDRYRFPNIYEPTPRITKYQGLDIWYLETYLDQPHDMEKNNQFYLWDDEFLCNLRNNQLYEETPLDIGICSGCSQHCSGHPVACFNPYLRNVVIRWFNDEGNTDWESVWANLQVTDDRTIENYYLLPLVMAIYKQYIKGLQE